MANVNSPSAGFTIASNAQHPDDILPSLVELFDPSIHDLCEFGDIMLVIEDGYHPQMKIRVSSCMLSSTSRVFRTLFRGCFVEGQAIPDGTREIFMNDKPAPMLAMCQLLHLKTVEPVVRESEILEFALLVDKFDCIQALKPATHSVFDQMNSSSPYSYDLIVSTFILDQQKHFRSFTKALVLYSQDLDPVRVADELVHEHLPEDFMALISRQHDAVRKELVYCITNLLDRFATASYGADEVDLVHDLMATMRSSGLWPIWPPNGRAKPLQEQLAAFSSIEIPTIVSAGHRHKYKSPYSHETDLTSRTLICLSDRLNDLCDGLCLDCLKGRDRCGRDLENHPDPWETYEVERENAFEWRKSFPSSPPSPIGLRNLRTMSPEMVVLDHGGGWGLGY
ncbi:hypothetical protein MBLNU13_g03520t1 [Cladosporium sp. NU13]